MERLAALGNEVYGGCYNVVAALTFEGPATAARLQRALDGIQAQHECLRVEVAADPTAPGEWVFRPTRARVRLEVIDRARAESWMEVWSRCSHTRIEGIAWRVFWVRVEGSHESQLVVLFHHAVSDGVSVSTFFDTILQSMHRAVEGVPEITRDERMLAPLTRLVGARYPLAALARIGFYRYLRRVRTVPFDIDASHDPIAARRWNTAFRTVDPALLAQALDACRRNSVSIGAAFSAATLLETADRVRAREGDHGFDMVLCTSVDLRRSTATPLDSRRMGLFASAVHNYFRPQCGTTVWSLAREASQRVERSIRRNEHRDLSLLQALIGPNAAAQFARENQGRPVDGALVVSNLGRVPGLEHGPFRATSLYATSAQAAWGCTLLLCLATVRGRLCVTLGYPSPALSDETAQALVDGVIARVRDAVAAG
jgi:hypothetical protein